MPLIEGQLDDFRIIREIGRGGMGTVFLAEQRNTGRRVAVKILGRATSLQSGCRRRFVREIHALARLNHPNVVSVYAAGEERGSLFYAMEWIDGMPLDRHVREAGLDQDDILRLFLTVCSGVAAAHRSGIIHRDLKPSNILVDAKGVPCIVDLGLAKFLEEEAGPESPLTITTAYMGTPAFMAPEQCGKGGSGIDTRTDIYALGVILYLLLLETLPYPVPTDILESIDIICNRPPTRPRKIKSAFPVDLELVLLKALSKEPEQRYESVAEFANDLDNVLQLRPVSAHAPSFLYLSGRYVRRNWRSLTLVASLTVALILVIVVAFVNVNAARIEAVRARDEALKARAGESEARRAQAREAYGNTVSTARQKVSAGRFLEAEALLRQTPEEVRGWEWGRLMRLARPEAYRWQVNGTLRSLTPMVEGDRLAVRHGDTVALHALSGEVLKTCTIPQGMELLAVNPADGQIICRDATTGKVMSIAGVGGRRVANVPQASLQAAVGQADSGTPFHLCFSPIGTRLMVTGESHADVFVWPTFERLARLSLQNGPGVVVPEAAVADSGTMVWIEEIDSARTVVAESLAADPGNHLTWNVLDDARVLAPHPGGRFFAVGTLSGIAIRDCLFDTYTPTLHGGRTDALAFSRDGRLLAVYMGGVVTVHPVSVPESTAPGTMALGDSLFSLADSGIAGLCFSPGSGVSMADLRQTTAPRPGGERMESPANDSPHLVCGMRDGAVRVFPFHQSGEAGVAVEKALAFSSNGYLLRGGEALTVATLVSEEGGLAVRSQRSLSGIPSSPFFDPVTAAGFSADGSSVCVCLRQSPVAEVYDALDGEGRCLPAPSALPVVDCHLSGDGSIAMLVDERGAVTVYSVEQGMLIFALDEKTGPPRALLPDGSSVVFTRDAKEIVSRSVSARGIDLTGAERVFPLPGVRAICISPDSRLLALARETEVILLDMTRDMREVCVLQPLQFSGSPQALAFSADGGRLAIGETEGVSLWNTITSQRMLDKLGPQSPAAHVLFMDDGSLLIHGEDGTITVLRTFREQ